MPEHMKLVRTWQHTEVTIFTFFGHREWSSRSCKYCLRSYFLSEYSQDHSTLGLFLIMIFYVMSILWSIIMVVLDQDFRARGHGLFFQILFIIWKCFTGLFHFVHSLHLLLCYLCLWSISISNYDLEFRACGHGLF